MIVTLIKQQKNKNRINVYLDNKFGFGIDLDNFVIFNLKVGQELTEKQIEDIIKKSQFQKTLDKLTRFVMIRPKSEKEVKDYLKRKKIPEIIWKDLFTKLVDYDLINDEKFTKWWVETRQEFSPKSKMVLINELKLKGIKKEMIDEVLNETNLDEKKIARNQLGKRSLHWKTIEKNKRNQKMLEYLIRKGFGFEIAKKAAKEYNNEHDNEK